MQQLKILTGSFNSQIEKHASIVCSPNICPKTISQCSSTFDVINMLLAMSLKLLAFFTTLAVFATRSNAQSIQEICPFPNNIDEARQNRLRHPCESNQNPYFAIVTNSDFYCVFYSVLEISLFGAETNFEIKLKGQFDYEQVRDKILADFVQSWILR